LNTFSKVALKDWLKVHSFQRAHWLALGIPVALYILLHIPAVFHAPGGQDEHWFSVPGLTVWKEGIPRIPYVPTRNRETFFENTDKCLMALPPGLFYLQAPFFAFLPAGYPTARVPLFLAALLSIGLLYFFAKRLGASTLVACLVAMVFAIGRPLMFTGQTARPDLLCALAGWISILLLWRFFDTQYMLLLFASGFVCGLGALFHPFAMVFALQAGAAICSSRSNMAVKLKHLLSFGGATTLAVSLWLPLILRFPYEFRSQFFSNVMDRAGPGLPSRLIWPWPALRHHATLVYEFAGPWQCGLLGIATVCGCLAIWRTRTNRRALAFIGLCCSSIFLTAVVAGLHPTKGYWVYPCFWILGGLAIALETWLPSHRQRVWVGILLIAMTLPGAGLKTTYLYVRHWGDPRFHGPKFIANVLSELPREGLFLADLSYVFDVYVSGRQTLLCQEKAIFWGQDEIKFTALLLASEGEDANWAPQYDAVLQRRIGSRELEQECFVDIYVPRATKDE